MSARSLPDSQSIKEEFQNLRMQNVPIAEARKYLAEKYNRTETAIRMQTQPSRMKSKTDEADPLEADLNAFGTSTLYDADGKVKLQWIKRKKQDEIDQLRRLVDEFQVEIEPVEPRPLPHLDFADDLLAVYPMGDPHLGLHSWHPETGADFDLKIAEKNLCAAVDHLVRTAPNCGQALVISVGDFFHSDNKQAHTTNSLHTLDVDTRYGKVLETGVRAFRQCIGSALNHHAHVTVACALGNHDWHTSMFLSVTLKHIYENEPRVTVMDSFAPRNYYRFHNNLFGITHGDTVKPENLPLLMASESKEDWGATQHRMWITGHIHHTVIKEYPGCTVETFNTLAPRDAWHAEKGYMANRHMKALVFHKTFGEVGRNTVSVQMLELAP